MAKTTIDFNDETDHLVRSARARADKYRRLAEQLTSPDDRLLVDVGCGGGGMAAALARARPQARVIGLDSGAVVLDAARAYAAEVGVDVEFIRVDLTAGHRALTEAIDGPADLVWGAGVVHHAGDQQAALDDLTHLVAPGGRLVIAEGGLTPRNLPWDVGIGSPGLQARLDEASNRWFTRLRADMPDTVAMPYGWNTAFTRAGCSSVTTVQDVEDWPAPLDAAQRDRVLHGLSARVGWCEELLDDEDREVWTRLLDPDDEHWLGHREDLFHLAVNTIYIGQK